MRKQTIMILAILTALLASSAHATPEEWHGGTYDITSGTYFEVGLFDNAQATISGSATFGRLEIYDTSKATFLDDAFSHEIWLKDTSRFVMDGGSIYTLWLFANSKAIISGGTIATDIGAIEGAHVDIVAVNPEDITITPLSDSFWAGRLQGYLLDGSYIDVYLRGEETLSRINVIPEPTCVLLMIAGLPYVRKVTRNLR